MSSSPPQDSSSQPLVKENQNHTPTRLSSQDFLEAEDSIDSSSQQFSSKIEEEFLYPDQLPLQPTPSSSFSEPYILVSQPPVKAKESVFSIPPPSSPLPQSLDEDDVFSDWLQSGELQPPQLDAVSPDSSSDSSSVSPSSDEFFTSNSNQSTPAPHTEIYISNTESTSSTEQDPRFESPKDQSSPPFIIAVAGGKGGIGRSLVSAHLGMYLARLSHYSVMLVDLDPNGGNLHTYLGVDPLLLLPGQLLREKPVPYLEKIKGYERLSLCRIPHSLTHAISEDARRKALDFAIQQPVDVIILDLGHFGDPFTLDTFLSSYGVMMFTPDPPSIERLYGFIRMALYHHLLHQGLETDVVSRALLVADQIGKLHSPLLLVQSLEQVNPQASIELAQRLQSFSPQIIVNQCRTRIEREMNREVCAALYKRWQINASPLASIDFDDVVWKAVHKRMPLMQEFPGSSICSDLERLTRKLINHEIHRHRPHQQLSRHP